MIPLDAIFSPVKKVGFRVENMWVGERTDFDRLFLEIETDGTITPEEVFFQASEILVNHFNLFAETYKKEERKEKEEKIPLKEKKEKVKPKKKSNEPEEMVILGIND